MIKIEKLTKSFGKNEVLKGIDTTIKEGEVVAVIGLVWFRKINISSLY